MADNDPIINWILGESNLEGFSYPSSDNHAMMPPSQFEPTLMFNDLAYPPMSGNANGQSGNILSDSTAMDLKTDMNNKRSDDDEDYLSDSQLKLMTSKERRQLRNKISARKFRNRRKEYITMLEGQVQKQKAENNQLRLEITWIRSTADKLQKENDQLRLQLVLCQEGIQPRRSLPVGMTNPVPLAIVPPVSTVNFTPPMDTVNVPSAVINDPTVSLASQPTPRVSLSPPSFGGDAFVVNSDSSTVSSNNNPSPPELLDLADHWELMPPPETNVQQNTYLSHAVMPDWDFSSLLKKQKMDTPTVNMFHKYPLLVPALMSIVLDHTMTMATSDMMAAKMLLPPPGVDDSARPRFLANELFFGPKIGLLSRKNSISGKDIQSMWEAQMQAFGSAGTKVEQQEDAMWLEKLKQFKEQEQDQEQSTRSTLLEYCPLNWLQRQFCRLVYEHVIARYPHLEPQCRMYLPICDKLRRTVQSR